MIGLLFLLGMTYPTNSLLAFNISGLMELRPVRPRRVKMSISAQKNELKRLNWRKSAHSVNGGNCTEVAAVSGAVVVRDSMDPDTLVLSYPADSWSAFLAAARTGRFDSIG